MGENAVITLSIPEQRIDELRRFYEDSFVENPSPYVTFSAKQEGVSIIAYSKVKNGCCSVVFQGPNAAHEASIWGEAETPTSLVIKRKPEPGPIATWRDQIGSDEVGTGDFFGPVIVVACYVQFEDRPLLLELGVADSKTLDDAKILQIGPQLIQNLDYSQLYLPPEKYNAVRLKGNNMNAIKAKMHNRCLLNVASRHPKATVYQDQFAAPDLYYSYLSKEPEVQRGIIFATKGESKFLSVAAASVIARYSFLRHMAQMGKEYGLEFPFGAGANVDEFATEFVKRFGLGEIEKVAKTNFANYKKLG